MQKISAHPKSSEGHEFYHPKNTNYFKKKHVINTSNSVPERVSNSSNNTVNGSSTISDTGDISTDPVNISVVISRSDGNSLNKTNTPEFVHNNVTDQSKNMNESINATATDFQQFENSSRISVSSALPTVQGLNNTSIENHLKNIQPMKNEIQNPAINNNAIIALSTGKETPETYQPTTYGATQNVYFSDQKHGYPSISQNQQYQRQFLQAQNVAFPQNHISSQPYIQYGQGQLLQDRVLQQNGNHFYANGLGGQIGYMNQVGQLYGYPDNNLPMQQQHQHYQQQQQQHQHQQQQQHQHQQHQQQQQQQQHQQPLWQYNRMEVTTDVPIMKSPILTPNIYLPSGVNPAVYRIY